ncbi:chemotaxis protein CheW [Methanospirillum lacunae]|uniref:Chemotaxis protein CheW n=1 Tax=Methanospirillum lacunae TaxID=668570 RepID=A0A2V2N8F6_9EURY|nr:chemotaxis protein CheW [Methanospirillum lacunae]PWR73966.1 chemotaxis protein CheW [Methanospirillum lacunae]
MQESVITSQNESGYQSSNIHQATGSRDIKVIEFIIESQPFAINLFDTKEVINCQEITLIPNSPSYIRGITNLRGVITSVIDIKNLLSINSEKTDQKKKDRIIILDPSICQKPIGILVDDVRSVQNYSPHEIDIHESSSDHYQKGVIKRSYQDLMGKDISELILLLDVKKIVQNINLDW